MLLIYFAINLTCLFLDAIIVFLCHVFFYYRYLWLIIQLLNLLYISLCLSIFGFLLNICLYLRGLKLFYWLSFFLKLNLLMSMLYYWNSLTFCYENISLTIIYYTPLITLSFIAIKDTTYLSLFIILT